MSNSKRCPTCKNDKPRNAYAKNKNNADGLQRECRECMSIRRSPNARKSKVRTYLPDEYGFSYSDENY